MKKTALLLAICIMVSMCSVVFAETQGTFYETYGIWFDPKTSTVTGCEEGLIDLRIPSKVNGQKVLCIGEEAFLECDTLETVTLPDSITLIESRAFAGCTNLKQLSLPSNLVDIQTEAFAGCTALSNIVLPRTLETLADGAFMGCIGLTQIKLPVKLKQMGETVFGYCENLTSITISDSNDHYSDHNGILFNKEKTKLIQYPAKLKGDTYEVPETVTVIGNGAFSYCENLTQMTLPKGLKTIGEFAFFNCDKLTEMAIPHSVTAIGKEAFGWCDSLETVTLPNQLTKIEYGLFWYNQSLKQMTIPDSVTTISDYAFAQCEALESVELPPALTSLGQESFAFCKKLSRVVLPQTVNVVGNKAFADSGVFRVTIQNGDTEFGEEVFENCGYLLFFTPEHTPAQQYALKTGNEWEKIVTVTYLGHEIVFDQPPVTRYDRTLVPVRAIFETMGAEVNWEESTKTVTATRGDVTLVLQIDNQTMTKNGEAVILDVPAQQIHDRTLVPARAVAEGLNCDIYWDEETQTVAIWEKE